MKTYIYPLLLVVLGWFLQWIWQEYKSAKTIEFSIEESFGLIDVKNDPFVNDVKIYYKEKRISNINRLSAKITSVGGQAIEAKDIADPIMLEFPANTQILHYYVSERIPSNISWETKIEGQTRLRLSPNLINPKDTLGLVIYTSGGNAAPPILVGRIKDASIVNTGKKSESNKKEKFNWVKSIVLWPTFIFFTLLTPIALFQTVQMRRLRTRFPHQANLEAALISQADYIGFFEKNLKILPKEDKNLIRFTIYGDENTFNNNRSNLAAFIFNKIHTNNNPRTAMIFCAIVSVFTGVLTFS